MDEIARFCTRFDRYVHVFYTLKRECTTWPQSSKPGREIGEPKSDGRENRYPVRFVSRHKPMSGYATSST